MDIHSSLYRKLLHACLFGVGSDALFRIHRYAKTWLSLSGFSSDDLDTVSIQSHGSRPYIIAAVLLWQTFVFLSCTNPKTN